MKKLLYALLGLWLFGVQTTFEVKAQISQTQIQARKGVVTPAAGLPLPVRKGDVSPILPINDTTTTQFYYLNNGGMVLLPPWPKGGGGGGGYQPGVGLNLSNGYLNLNQYPMSIGTPFIDGLRWRGFPDAVNGSTIALNNSRFLFRQNDQTLETSFNEIRNEISNYVIYNQIKNLDLGLGLKIVKPPRNQNSPGAVGELSYYLGYWYMYGQKDPDNADSKQWFRWTAQDTFTSGYEDNAGGNNSPPVLTGQFNQSKLNLFWTTARTDVQSWDIFISVGDSTHYNLEASGIAAGLRAYDVQTYGGSVFYAKIRGRLAASGAFTPFSNQVTILPNYDNAYLPVTDVVLTPQNGSNSIRVDYTTQDADGQVVLEISSDPAATATSDNSWGGRLTSTVGAPGRYNATFNNINDYNARKIRIWRQGGTKTPSPRQLFGPVSLTNPTEPVNTPTITGITANSAGTAATITYLANNTNYTQLNLYRSEDGGNTFGPAINAGNSGSTYTDNGLTPGKTYVYKAQVLKNNTYSAFSDNKSVTMPGAPTQQEGPTFTNYSFTANGSTSDGDNAFGYGNQFKYTYQPVQVYQSYTLDGDMRVNDGAWTDVARSFSASFNTNTQKGYGAIGEIVAPAVAKSNNIVRLRIRFRQITSNNGGTVTSPWSKNILKITYGPNYDTNNNDKKWELEAVSDQTPTGQVPPSAQALQFSTTNITESSITISIINPSNAGTINYNWAIYAGDPDTPNTYRCSKYDNPSSGTLTISTSACTNLVAGQQYRLYLAQSNGAGQPQTRQAYINFTQPGNTGGGGGGAIQWGVVPSDVKSPPGGIYYMQNDQLRIGLNMNAGGAIWEAYHADEPQTQLVNDMDYGRQWQYAYYAFPVDNYKPNGKDPAASMWSGIGYDPIQAGDFTSPSQVLQFKEDPANGLVYFRTRPRLWGYRDIEASCYVDTWIRITGNFVEFRNICHNERVNDPQYVNLPRGQDIGGAFTNGKYYESTTYMGNQPWTNQPLTARRILYDFPFENYVPGDKNQDGSWVYPDKGDFARTLQFYNPERWLTLRNPENGKYIGLWSQSPLFNHQTGGREQGKWEGQYGGAYVTFGTQYSQAIMDKRQVFDYEYTYMIGSTPAGMRQYAYNRRDFKNVIDWDFSVRHNDWWMNNQDQMESPFDGSWYAPGDKNQMNRVSPELAVEASKYTHIQVTMAVGGNQQKVGLSFLRRNNNGLLYDHTDVQYQFDVIADGQMRTYTIDLRQNPNYGGILYRIYLDVFGQPQAGRWSRVKSIKGIYQP